MHQIFKMVLVIILLLLVPNITNAEDIGGVDCLVFEPNKVVDHNPVIVFSTGCYMKPSYYSVLGKHWAENGFAVIMPRHADPIGSYWGASLNSRLSNINKIINAIKPGTPIAVAGHSLGGTVTEMLGGAKTSAGIQTNERIDCIVTMSAPGRWSGFLFEDSWQTVKIPHLVLTGQQDLLSGSNQRDPYALSAEDNTHVYYKVMKGQNHFYANSQPAREYSTQFLKAYLNSNTESLSWLKNNCEHKDSK